MHYFPANRTTVYCTVRGWMAIVSVALLAPVTRATDLETIERAWMKRQEQTPSIVIRWSETRVRLVRDSSKPGQREIEQKVPETTLYISGRKARFEETYGATVENPEPGVLTSAFNGKAARSLCMANGHPSGRIHEDGPPLFARSIAVTPTTLLYRGCDSMLTLAPLSAFRLRDNGKTDASGRIALELVDMSTRLGPQPYTLWVDPDMDFAPVQMTATTSSGITLVDIRIELERADSGIVVPKSWSTTMTTEKGILLGAKHATVRSCSFDEPLPKELFELPFPVGTWVKDSSEESTPGLSARHYILLEGGRRREILHSELAAGLTYEELLHSETGKAIKMLPDRSSSHRMFFFWGNVVVVVGLLGVWLRRRWGAR